MDGQGTGADNYNKCDCPSSGKTEHNEMRTTKFQSDIGDADLSSEKGDKLMMPQSEELEG